MSPTLTRALCAALLVALLCACGQRGPLTLPDKKKQTAPAASPSEPPKKPKPDDAQQ